MSKGEIVGHIAEGKYRVRQKLAVEGIQQELEVLNARIAELAIMLPLFAKFTPRSRNILAERLTDTYQKHTYWFY